MGTSTDAILTFGVALHDYDDAYYQDLPWAADDDEDFDHTIARRAGAPDYPNEGWLQQKREAVKACGLELVYHCSLDCASYILAIKSTTTTARRGFPEVIENTNEPESGEIQELLAFLAEFGIEGDPQWLLCSMWG